jgi:transposase
VPQSYAWGVEAQVDWYEAYADLAGERVKLQVFAMRSMASGAAFHCAYLHATRQAFLEGHELAFAYFGGVFRKLRYDNLTSAVTKILRGHRREETSRFVAFRSHWRFEAEFCTPAEPHEKGGIEGEAGYFRRNHWVPAGLVIEREQLLPLAQEGFDLAQTSFPTVNGLGCAKVLTNTYSVPPPAGSPTVLTYLRLAPNRIVSAEPPRSRRKEPKQPNGGKPWK